MCDDNNYDLTADLEREMWSIGGKFRATRSRKKHYTFLHKNIIVHNNNQRRFKNIALPTCTDQKDVWA